jgi:ribonucleoside-diphosphate reductase beta chain
VLKLNQVLEKSPILEPEHPNKATAIVGGKASGILSWNDVRNALSFNRYKELLGNFWTPFEINMSDDVKQYKQFSEQEQNTFRKINGLVAILDSVQPRFFSVLLEYITDPAFQATLVVMGQQEVVHNHSYSYVLSSVEKLENQNIAFETARTEKPIYERNKLITEIYENIRKANPTVKDLLEALVASVALEGINFYSAFAYFYNLARNQKMLKTSTMISYINRDELVHTKIITDILNQIIEESPDLFEHVNKFAKDFFHKIVQKEIEWSQYILANEEDIDLVEMADYIKYRANKCLSMMRIKPLYTDIDDNPMPWIRAFMDENINLGKTDFFENRPRTYTKVSEDNGFDEL